VTERKAKPLARLEAKARQLMLMVGFGFLAYTGGTILSVMLMNRLNHRLVAADNRFVTFAVLVLVGQLWILFVLPSLIHLASRFLELPIWRAAIIGALTGTFFSASIRIVSNGVETTFAEPVQNLVWAGCTLSGIFFSVWAGKRGRVWAEARQKVADAAAEARKGQYDQFLAESTQLANRRESARNAEAAAALAAQPLPTVEPSIEPTVAPGDPKPPA